MDETSADPNHNRLNLPFEPASVSVARHAVGDWLDGFGPESGEEKGELIDDVRLVVSELVGNAVLHADPLEGGTMDVTWECTDERIELSVRDGGGMTRPEQREAAPTDLGGRGLQIVNALTTQWWVESDGDSTTVRAVIG